MNKSTALQYAGLKLSFALMLGLLVVPAYVVAPMLFTELESATAGLIAGKVFHISNLAILILAMASALFCYRIEVAKSTWYLLLSVFLLVAINVFGVSSVMAMIKVEAGDISSLASDDKLRFLFAFWHGLGSILQLISTLLMAALVMKKLSPESKEKADT